MGINTPLISKTHFMMGMQCELRLWYQVYRRDLIPEVDSATQAKFDTGHLVGDLARKVFPNGKLVESDYLHHTESIELTKVLINNKSVLAIFEAGFLFDDVRVRVDVLKREAANKWTLIEVKSTNSVKEEHYYDAGIQRHVLNGSGINLVATSLMHLNRDYVFDGKELDLDNLFIIEDISEAVVQYQADTLERLETFKAVLRSKTPPKVEPGSQCTGCEFYGHCTKNVPEHWILNLPRIGQERFDSLIKMGIRDIASIPDTFPLTASQALIRECTLTGKEYLDPDLHDSLDGLKYPIHFLDFETIMPAIPRYAGTRPYQQIPFQWSLHILSEDETLKHFEFLHDGDTDPRLELTKALLDAIGAEGSVIHYTPFETTVLRGLAQALPKYERQINKIIARLWDICAALRKYYYHPKFHGSYSIKQVLPALVPKMSYADMEIQDGTMASFEYFKMISPNMPESERARIRKALLTYCGQDSLGMVEVFRALMKRAEN